MSSSSIMTMETDHFGYDLTPALHFITELALSGFTKSEQWAISLAWPQSFLILNSGSLCRFFHIPMFDKVSQIELTILTSLGWEFSNLFTEVESPFKDRSRSCGFFSSRIAS